MKIIRVTYFALLTLISAASCSKEAAEMDVIDWAEDDIHFRTSLSEVASSRGENMTLDDLESFQVTCFSADLNINIEGYVTPYFENAKFIRRGTVPGRYTYVCSPEDGPLFWPTSGGRIRFYAFAPSLSDMAVSTGNTYFNLINRSSVTGSALSVDYRLSGIHVNPDISQQYDFVTAEAAGERFNDFGSEVELNFRHRMSQIELRAWGASENYGIEIAGVRLGNPAVTGEFVFCNDADPTRSGNWVAEKTTGKVEYLYRGSDDTESRDKIYRINSSTHNTQTDAATIMGRGGCAMVIPTVNPRWEALDDPNIGDAHYTTPKMYFSILLRVTAPEGNLYYPYPGNIYGQEVIYYAVDQSDAIITRVYPGGSDGKYYTDSSLQQPYVAAEGETVKEFSWAAVPVDADWSQGNRFVYTLDYSAGIGLHDPQDPEPGKPIILTSPVSWSVTVDTWQEAVKDDNFDPDINVPETL